MSGTGNDENGELNAHILQLQVKRYAYFLAVRLHLTDTISNLIRGRR